MSEWNLTCTATEAPQGVVVFRDVRIDGVEVDQAEPRAARVFLLATPIVRQRRDGVHLVAAKGGEGDDIEVSVSSQPPTLPELIEPTQ